MDKVSIVRCDDYDYKKVRASVYGAIELLGGMSKFVTKGSKVLVKPNLLKKAPVEKNVTTNPVVFRAVLEAVRDAGAKAVVAESPGGFYSKGILQNLYKASGIGQAAADAGAELSFDTDTSEVKFDDGVQTKTLELIKPAVETDACISVAKLKTHELMMYTGAVKNLFGLIPGVKKVEYHFRVPEQKQFGDMLVDIERCIKPVFSLIDGVYGMEGDGPSAGQTRKIGAVIASPSAHAADIAALKIIGMDPEHVFTVQCAIERGIIGLGDIEYLGEPVENLYISDYKFPKSHARLLDNHVPGAMGRAIENYAKPRPVIPKKKCVGCGVCLKNCPAKAMELKDKVVIIDYKKCINCYCCHELCPEDIIKIKRPFVFKLFK